MNNNRKKCPYCGEEIAATAKKCRFYGEWLDENAAPTRMSVQNVRQAPLPSSAPAQQPSSAPIQQPIVNISSAPGNSTNYSDNSNYPDASNPQKNARQAGGFVFDEPEKGFFEAYLLDSFFKKYARFSGYTSVKEFWLTYVALMVASMAAGGLALLLMGAAGMPGMIAGIVLESLFALAIIIPGFALTCRRLRDGGFSPWLILLSLISAIGTLILLVMCCLPSKQQHNAVSTRFTAVDGIIIGVSILLMAIGAWMSMKSVGNLAGFMNPGSSYLNETELTDGMDGDSVEAVDIVEEATPVTERDEYIDITIPSVVTENGIVYFNTPGEHRLNGNFIYNGQEFPVRIDYTVDSYGEITVVKYYNIAHNASAKLACYGGYYTDSRAFSYIIFRGKDRGKDFIITLDYDEDLGMLTGEAETADITLNVELKMVK